MQPRIFEVIWAIGAIALGSVAVFGTDWYVSHTIKWANWLYEKTKFPFYKLQAQETGKSYVRISFKLIGLVMIVLGVTLLLGAWHTGPQ